MYLLISDCTLSALDKYANNNGIIGYSYKVLQFGTLRAYIQLYCLRPALGRFEINARVTCHLYRLSFCRGENTDR